MMLEGLKAFTECVFTSSFIKADCDVSSWADRQRRDQSMINDSRSWLTGNYSAAVVMIDPLFSHSNKSPLAGHLKTSVWTLSVFNGYYSLIVEHCMNKMIH